MTPRTVPRARALAAAAALAFGLGAAPVRDTAIVLEFEGSVEGARPVLEGRALTLGRAVDARPDEARAAIGQKTRDDGVTRVTTTDDPAPFLIAAASAALPAWGARLDPASGPFLHARLLRFDVEESWGYTARVKVAWTLEDAHGRILFEKTSTGTAKRSSVMPGAKPYNAILSAAALDAVGRLAADPEFLEAAGRKTAPAPEGGRSGDRQAPEAILEDLKRLADEGLGGAILDAWLREQRFSRAMTADDLVAWKRAGFSDELIGLAFELSSAPAPR